MQQRGGDFGYDIAPHYRLGQVDVRIGSFTRYIMTLNESTTDCIVFNISDCHSSPSFYLRIRVPHTSTSRQDYTPRHIMVNIDSLFLTGKGPRLPIGEFKNSNVPNDGNPALGLYSIIPKLCTEYKVAHASYQGPSLVDTSRTSNI